MKSKFNLHKVFFAAPSGIGFFMISAAEIFAQIKPVTFPANDAAQEDYTWWYLTLGALLAGLVGAVVWWLKNKKAAEQESKNSAAKQKNQSWESNSLDADKEMEWLRKNQNLVGKKRKRQPVKKTVLPNTRELNNSFGAAENASAVSAEEDIALPVFGFEELSPANPFMPLPLSNNESLLSAIEQTHDEDEEDEEVRELAVRILAAFKTRNSVESLAQVALYDLSSSLRSKAVSILTDFDHECVFETILLACADPTREVRAAAARGLTRLSFDRADAWARIAESGEEGRIRHAARAATEGGFAAHSFERLIHPDRKNAYEAFVLLSLLIKAGEVEPIFDAIKNHPNPLVKSAVLHLIKVTKDPKSLEILYNLLEDKNLPEALKKVVDETIEEISLVAA